MQPRTRGYLAGITAAVSYGLNPLFAVPLFGIGVDTSSMLIYRYGLAIVMLWVMMLVLRRSLRLSRRQVCPMCALGVLFGISSLTLFESYRYMDVGMASTMLFVYPVIVALLNRFAYGERIAPGAAGAIVLSMAGIAMLYFGGGEEGGTLDATGVVLVGLSALSYALYLVGVNRTCVNTLPSSTLTFYSLLTGMSVYVVALGASGQGLAPLGSPTGWACAAGLAIFPTILSLLAINISIHDIGSTPTAVLGALEPATGVVVGILAFGERLTLLSGSGVALVIASVVMLVATRRSQAGSTS